MPRPSDYSQDIAEAICARIASGESLRAICKDAGMPDARTVHRWVANITGFRQHYARAREVQADALAEEIIEIADDTTGDTTTNSDGVEVVNHEHIQRSRLRVDARKWFASKVAPKKYGDRLELAGDAENPLTVLHTAAKALDEKLDRMLGRRDSDAAGKPQS